MTIIAVREATAAVKRFVDNLNRHLSETDGSRQGPGAGTRRRIEREKAKAKAEAARWKEVGPKFEVLASTKKRLLARQEARKIRSMAKTDNSHAQRKRRIV